MMFSEQRYKDTSSSQNMFTYLPPKVYIVCRDMKTHFLFCVISLQVTSSLIQPYTLYILHQKKAKDRQTNITLFGGPYFISFVLFN